MLEAIFDLIFPPKCIFCGKLLGYGVKVCICNECSCKISYLKCRIKGVKKSDFFDDIICTCEYTGIIKEALIKYKFYNRPSFARSFAWLIYSVMMEMGYDTIDFIIAVPLHRTREHNRGYNQAYLIAKQLGSLLGIKVVNKLLIRTKSTNSQSLLGRNERLHNVRDAFAVTNSAMVTGKSVLIVDDVFTTGSTINECCKVLKQAGTNSITAVVVATGRKL